MSQRIDAFAHVLPKPFYEEMKDVHPTEELHAIGDELRFYDHETRLRDLNEFGIDKQVLSLARPPIWNGMNRDPALEMTKVANNAVKQFSEKHPDRFIPIATLPRMDDGFVQEFKRCIDELGMAGVQIFSNMEGEPIDGDEFYPLYEAATKRDVPVWLHPQLHEWHEWDYEYMLHKILGWPFDTSLALGRLVFGGVLEEYPDLKIIPHHMGAMIPHFVSRLELFYEMLVEHPEVYPYPVTELEENIENAFSSFYADTCRCGDPNILQDGLDFFGKNNLVFATDYPFGPEEGRKFLREEVAGVERMDIDHTQKRYIFSENVKSIINYDL